MKYALADGVRIEACGSRRDATLIAQAMRF
jgi:hypothetical protein